jgi:hypothetical protein
VILSLSELCRISGQGKDNAETVMAGFLKYATVPVVNMEGHRSPITIPCRCDYHGRAKQIIDQRSFYPGHHTQKLCLKLLPILRGNDAIARPILSHILKVTNSIRNY